MTAFDEISCIVPAFNEAPRIGAVAAQSVRRAPVVQVIRQPENGGKTRASQPALPPPGAVT